MNVMDSTRRPRGRPQARPDAETRHVIAEAARAEFMANGYASTGMDAVAKRAGVSKKTLYRLVPTKAALFKASVADRIDSFLLAVDPDILALLDIEAGIERILHEFGRLTLAVDTIAIQRLVLAESDRFPDLATDFYAAAIVATHTNMTRYLTRMRDEGALVLDDPHVAAGMLRGMMIMEPQRAAMLGQRGAPTESEIAARATACARLFLHGCRP
ncbi:TetR/AcrR family transcriptional regulator [Lichenifustis flavocetrariae]